MRQDRQLRELHKDPNYVITLRAKGKCKIVMPWITKRVVSDHVSNIMSANWNEQVGFARTGWHLK